MLYGYVRVSEADAEDLFNTQMDKLKEFGCLTKNIFVERRSGVSGHRPAYNALMDAVGNGDEVVVLTLDRIGRSIENLAEVVFALRARGASLKTIGEPGVDLNTNELANTQHHALFDMLARFKQSIDRERKKVNAKRRTPSREESAALLLNWNQVQRAQQVMASREFPVGKLCQELGVSPPTLYEYVSPTGELRARGERVRRVFGQAPVAEAG